MKLSCRATGNHNEVADILLKVYPSVFQISVHEISQGLKYLVDSSRTISLYVYCLVFYQISCHASIFCMHNNVFKEHLVPRHHCGIEKSIRCS